MVLAKSHESHKFMPRWSVDRRDLEVVTIGEIALQTIFLLNGCFQYATTKLLHRRGSLIVQKETTPTELTFSLTERLHKRFVN